jgi:DNA-directed RNA polymerase subunit RPC12/RpoP
LVREASALRGIDHSFGVKNVALLHFRAHLVSLKTLAGMDRICDNLSCNAEDAMTRAWQRFALVIALTTPAIGVAQVAELEPAKKDYAQDFHPDLQSERADIPGLILFGPEASQCVKPGADGLRITLPLEHLRQRAGTGVITDFGVQGDFEITMDFEILQEPTTTFDGNPTYLQLVVVPVDTVKPDMWQKANQNRAAFTREFARRNRMGQLVADVTKWNNEEVPKDQWGNEVFDKIETHADHRAPAIAKSGRLRMVRSGADLFFYAKEGPAKDFALFHKSDFGKKDLKNIRILASTGGKTSFLDARVTDFRVRADGFSKTEPAALAADADTRGRNWRLLMLATVPPIAVGLGLLAWFVGRRRHRSAEKRIPAEAASDILFICAGCGKRLKAKAAKVGAKIKCPQCGNAALVPQTQPSKPGEIS